MTVNDNMFDSLVEDLNNLLKNIASGQYIVACSLTVGMVQKMANIKKNILDDRKSLENQIADLQRLNNELAEKAFNNGEETNPEE